MLEVVSHDQTTYSAVLSSIHTYLSGIHQLQIVSSHSDPHIDHMLRLQQILKGMKVQAAQSRKTTHSQLQITPSILQKLKSIWMDCNPSCDDLMLWAASVTTFFTFYRSGEITVEKEAVRIPKSTFITQMSVAVENSISLRSSHSTSSTLKQLDQFSIGVKVVQTDYELRMPGYDLADLLISSGHLPGSSFLMAQQHSPFKD